MTVLPRRLPIFLLGIIIFILQAFRICGSFLINPRPRKPKTFQFDQERSPHEQQPPTEPATKHDETTMKSVLKFMDKECRRLADPSYAKKMEKYFKHVHRFYGIKSPELRSVVKTIQSKHRDRWTAPLLLNTAQTLLDDSYAEKKMLAVYLLGVPSNLKLLQPQAEVSVRTIGTMIETSVADWATCDGLSSQVIRKLIDASHGDDDDDDDIVAEVESWSTSASDWKQRASCISFVPLARHGNHNDTIFRIATNVIQNPSRFPQLGVGWVLRELSLADEPAVIEFIQNHYAKFSREGLRYAIEKMDKPLRQELLRHKPNED